MLLFVLVGILRWVLANSLCNLKPLTREGQRFRMHMIVVILALACALSCLELESLVFNGGTRLLTLSAPPTTVEWHYCRAVAVTPSMRVVLL